MKVHKMLSLETDIADRLSKMKNASAFVEKLLRDKFKLETLGICEHEWSNAFTTPGGLCKECRLCGRTKFLKVS